jgi:Zn-dependent oligopeptidase
MFIYCAETVRQNIPTYLSLLLCLLIVSTMISEEHWSRTMRRVWKQFMPLPLHDDDHHPCSFSPIFADQYAAAYYSIKWSEVSKIMNCVDECDEVVL